MERSGLDPEYTMCKIVVLPIKLYPPNIPLTTLRSYPLQNRRKKKEYNDTLQDAKNFLMNDLLTQYEKKKS